jgi:hypothetical protein
MWWIAARVRRCSHNDTRPRAEPQVRGLVDLGCHYANTPMVRVPSMRLGRRYTALRFGTGDR